MGVPSFFVWLTEKYKGCTTPAYSSNRTPDGNGDDDGDNDGDNNDNAADTSTTDNTDDTAAKSGGGGSSSSSSDISRPCLVNNGSELLKPNPNGIEFDNLYLDMNGLIHPACHSNEDVTSIDEPDEAKFLRIFDEIDKVFAIVRPRKLVYMAIDGVAPRAKMNQQRARRFVSVSDKQWTHNMKHSIYKEIRRVINEDEEYKSIRDEETLQSLTNLPKNLTTPWDSNVITPGTPFMSRLAVALRYYVHLRINTNVAWQNVRVIFSDGNVPGEGEHKIMKFIREQRAQPGYDPNLRHVMYGADADLIFLGLATHEAHFYILRESITRGRELLIFFDLNTFRYLLQVEFSWMLNATGFDIERIIDDIVFLFFFVGNDFIPAIPSLSIREGGLEVLLSIYKQLLPTFPDYITDRGEINFTLVESIFRALAEFEQNIFVLRSNTVSTTEEAERTDRAAVVRKIVRSYLPDVRPTPSVTPANATTPPTPVEPTPKPASPTDVDNDEDADEDADESTTPTATPTASTPDSDITKKRTLLRRLASRISTQFVKQVQTMESSLETKNIDIYSNKVKLGQDGWKERYYDAKFKTKFDSSPESVKLRERLVESYLHGLAWVLRYYYQSCCSWTWFYPFHYAPFASDFVNLAQFKIQFELGAPFHPFDQLMAVLPPASAAALPPRFSQLMCDKNSGISDYYPTEISRDLNGYDKLYKAVVLMPFVDEKRLLLYTKSLLSTLTQEEKQRNMLKVEELYVYWKKTDALGSLMLDITKGKVATNDTQKPKKRKHDENNEEDEDDQVRRIIQGTSEMLDKIPIPIGTSLFGYIKKSPNRYKFKKPIKSPFSPLPDIELNRVVSARFYQPPHREHNSALLKDACIKDVYIYNLSHFMARIQRVDSMSPLQIAASMAQQRSGRVSSRNPSMPKDALKLNNNLQKKANEEMAKEEKKAEEKEEEEMANEEKAEEEEMAKEEEKKKKKRKLKKVKKAEQAEVKEVTQVKEIEKKRKKIEENDATDPNPSKRQKKAKA